MATARGSGALHAAASIEDVAATADARQASAHTKSMLKQPAKVAKIATRKPTIEKRYAQGGPGMNPHMRRRRRTRVTRVDNSPRGY